MNCKFRYFSRFRCVGRRSVAGFSVFFEEWVCTEPKKRYLCAAVRRVAGFGPVCKDGAAEGGAVWRVALSDVFFERNEFPWRQGILK